FELIQQQLEDSGAINVLRHGVVLSGEASQIEGLVSLARRALGLPAHLANSPIGVEISEERRALLKRQTYSTVSGLLLYSQSEQQRLAESSVADLDRHQPVVDRLVINPWRRMMDKLRQLI
ncbi:MAG: cell division protein FtsA, partial [Pseudomonadota bacterium]|nr:cell division protein FtsA [Pseudomonadota bacterium]